MSDWTEKNRAYFNLVAQGCNVWAPYCQHPDLKKYTAIQYTPVNTSSNSASTYNTKFSKTILQIIDEIQARRKWIGADSLELDSETEDEPSKPGSTAQNKGLRLLDYACGTGLVSRALIPYISQCVGLDVSESMVEEYNSSARDQGIGEDEMCAHVGNLLDPESVPESLAGPKFHGFDIAAVGMGFHHFPDPALAAKRLADRLRTGGVLFIVDFQPHEDPKGDSHGHGHAHEAAETVIHFGFSEEQVKANFEAAGVGGKFEYVVLGKGVVFSRDGKEHRRSLFMARGVKL